MSLLPADDRFRVELVQAAAGLRRGPLSTPAARLAGAEELACALGWRVRRGELAATTADAAAWERAYRAVAARNLFALAKLEELVAGLAARGIDAVALKGAALLSGGGAYPDPGARTMKDVDLLVPARAWKPSLAYMHELGATSMWPSPSRPCTRAMFREEPFLLPWGMPLDLHRSLTPIHPVDHAGLFARARRDGPVAVPDVVDTFVHLAIHVALDGYFLVMRNVLDGVLLLADATLAPAAVVERATAWSARRVTARWLRLLDRFAPLPAAWADALRALDPDAREHAGYFRAAATAPTGRRLSVYLQARILASADSLGHALPYVARWSAAFAGDVATIAWRCSGSDRAAPDAAG